MVGEPTEWVESGKQWTKHWVEGLGGTSFRLQKTNALLPLKSVLVIQPHSFRDIWRGPLMRLGVGAPK